MDRHKFNRQLAAAARQAAEEDEGAQALDRAVHSAIELIRNADLAGLSTFSPRAVRTPAATHEDLRHIDQLQHELGEGPCINALRQAEVVRVGDVTTDQRWPRWGPLIGERFDVRSSLAFRLYTDGQQIAALTLYAKKPDSFDEEDLIDGLAVAAQAAVTLAAASDRDQLREALRSRQVIGEAVGMLRERFDLTSEAAFDVLKRLSSHHNTKLFRIAQHIVTTGNLPESSNSDPNHHGG